MSERLAARQTSTAWPALVVLATVAAAAWVWLARPGAMAMDMTAGAAMAGMSGPPQTWTVPHAAHVLGMWVAMSLAMMIPTATPALLGLARARGRSARSILIFATEYLTLWLVFALGATVLQLVLEQSGLLVDGAIRNRTIAAIAIELIGLWQLLPVKRACLADCKSWNWPDDRAASGALRYGWACLGASAPLMALPTATGLMAAPWLAGLTLWLLLERSVPRPGWTAAIGGVGLMVAGLALGLAGLR